MADKSEGRTEKAAKRVLIEDVFEDYYRSKTKIFTFVFFRGVLFGVGTVIGGTIVVAGIVWFLSQFIGIPGIGEFIEPVIDTVQDR